MIEFRDNTVKLQIWDSAGQERYKALIPSYVRGASIIFILYDVSNKNTFTNVITWINFIKQVNTDDSILVLCGNKIDLPRQVSTSEGKILADKEKMIFFETSAKASTGVSNMMYTCISQLPFFESFQVEKETLIQELININNNTTEAGIFEIDVDKNNNSVVNPQNASNIVLNKNNIDDEKKKCNC